MLIGMTIGFLYARLQFRKRPLGFYCQMLYRSWERWYRHEMGKWLEYTLKRRRLLMLRHHQKSKNRTFMQKVLRLVVIFEEPLSFHQPIINFTKRYSSSILNTSQSSTFRGSCREWKCGLTTPILDRGVKCNHYISSWAFHGCSNYYVQHRKTFTILEFWNFQTA